MPYFSLEEALPQQFPSTDSVYIASAPTRLNMSDSEVSYEAFVLYYTWRSELFGTPD
jgi:hypothetical protein